MNTMTDRALEAQAKRTYREQQSAAFELARVRLRRAFRLRLWADAIAAVQPLRAFPNAYEDARRTIIQALEAALIGRSRADTLLDWLLLHAIASRANDIHQARQHTAEWFAAIPKFAGGAATITRFARGEPPVISEPAPTTDEAQLTISVKVGTLTAQVDRAETALLSAEFGLYQRGGEIVRIAFVPSAEGDEVLHVAPVDETHLGELMGRAASWWKHDARSRQEVPTRCPPDVPRAYLSRGPAEWRLPHLTGILDAPTLRADGSMIYIPGHDEQTGLVLAYRDEDFPYVADMPDEIDARAAVDVLAELLSEFPFVANEDRSVALAAILTAVVRRALPAAPLFAFTAPAPGTGKSCLVNIVHMIATGRPASALTWTGDPAEDRKQLDAALLEGASAIAFDNVTGLLGSDRLNQILTEPRASLRVLGQSRNVEVACQALITATGNNLAIAADMTRRTVLCRLDADVERPELRAFTADPLARIRANRGRYLGAALTILRAYHVAGRPGQPKPLGSFEAWSSWVRGAVMWLGCPDSVASMDAVREGDPTRSDYLAVLESWNIAFADRPVNVSDLMSAALDVGGNPELRTALLAIAGVNGTINARRLGMWLRERKGQIVGTMKIVGAGRRASGAMWALHGGRVAPTGDVLPMIRSA